MMPETQSPYDAGEGAQPSARRAHSIPPDRAEELAQRFSRFVSPEPNSGCWLWTGGMMRNGYGVFCIGGKQKLTGAHRASYMLNCGPIPAGMLVCHRCDVKSCVNPGHLFLGDYRENGADMVRKRRCPHARLSPADVAAIRASDDPGSVLARRFGVDMCTITDIRKVRSWGFVGGVVTPACEEKRRRLLSEHAHRMNEARRHRRAALAKELA